MSIKHLKIGRWKFVFVFRHRYEKLDEDGLASMSMWNEWELGFFFRRMNIVSKFLRDKLNNNKLKVDMVYSYMLGINLLICKAWFTVDRR